MRTEKIVKIVGILYILAGIVLFCYELSLFSDFQLRYREFSLWQDSLLKPLKFSGFEVVALVVFRLSYLFFVSVLPILFIFYGIGVFKLKIWTLSLSDFIMFYSAFVIIIHLFAFGFLVPAASLTILILSILMITFGNYFLNTKNIKVLFLTSDVQRKKLEKSKKVIRVFMGRCSVSAVFFYLCIVVILIYPKGNPFYVPRVKILYSKTNILSSDYIRHRINDIEISLPKDLVPLSSHKDVFSLPDKSLSVKFLPTLFEQMKPIYTFLGLGYDNGYQFSRRFIREKIGMIWLELKSIMGSKSDEIRAESFNAVVTEYQRSKKQIIEFSIYNKKDNRSCSIIFLTDENKLIRAQADKIIASLKFVSSEVNKF